MGNHSRRGKKSSKAIQTYSKETYQPSVGICSHVYCTPTVQQGNLKVSLQEKRTEEKNIPAFEQLLFQLKSNYFASAWIFSSLQSNVIYFQLMFQVHLVKKAEKSLGYPAKPSTRVLKNDCRCSAGN